MTPRPAPEKIEVTLVTPEREVRLAVTSEEALWPAALNTGLTLPAICHQGGCLTCAGRIEGAGKVDHRAADAYFPADAAAGFVLLCTATAAQGPLRIRTHMENEMRRHRLAHGLPAPYS
ncbi:MAG: 2Fe-2S iron-sulfur cluster binding domain-containing protein [Terriglobales bacterium]